MSDDGKGMKIEREGKALHGQRRKKGRYAGKKTLARFAASGCRGFTDAEKAMGNE